MKVQYKIKDIQKRLKEGLTPNEKEYYDGWNILPDSFHLTYQKEYVVYGLDYSKEGYINFLIVDDTEVSYPKIYPSEFFEITNNRISEYWIGTEEKEFPIKNIKCPNLISFKEIVENEYFFEDILDCKNNTCEIFSKNKELMDNEFPDNNIKSAEIIDANWVFCGYCDESWEVKSKQGVIVCPKCGKRNNNPFWKYYRI